MTTPALPLPAWPEETTPEGLTFFGNAAAILAAWRAHGAPNAFALGMLAQAEAESSLDPNAMGENRSGVAEEGQALGRGFLGPCGER
ncbi:hypothetical protein, partial [Rhodoblastus sp.]|uniref:hypothetical protein n=1 Tax=Rhodoblastus sp. TaxID=1962975 RepID=UPI003F964581